MTIKLPKQSPESSNNHSSSQESIDNFFSMLGEQPNSEEFGSFSEHPEAPTDNELFDLENVTQTEIGASWVKNPWKKTIIIGILSAVGLLGANFIFRILFAMPNEPEIAETPELLSIEKSQEKPDRNNLKGEIKSAKAIGRLGQDIEQAQTIEKAETTELPSIEESQEKPDRNRIQTETVKAPIKKVAASPPPVAPQPIPIYSSRQPVRATAPQATIPLPSVRQYRPPVIPPSRPLAVQPKSVTPVQPRQNTAVRPVPSQTTSNPQQQWQAMAEIGSYGDGGQNAVPIASVPVQPEVNRAQSDMLTLEMLEPKAIIPVGTTVKAQTVLPLVFQSNGKQKLLMKLTDSFGALEKDTYLVAEVSLQNGAVNSTVQGYIHNNELKSLPPESITVLGTNHLPLMATEHQANGGGGFPFGSVLLDGLGKALEYNNVSDFTSTISNGSSTITQTSGNNDLLSGFLEGALGNLSDQLKRQQQPRQLNQSFWYLPAQTQITLFVQTPIKL